MTYFKITDNPKIKTSELIAECKKLFPVYCYWNDEELDKYFPAPAKETTRYFKHNQEADEEHKNKSLNQLEKEGYKIITMRERAIMELQYYKETNSHLDVVNITICSDRLPVGDIPCVNWFRDGVYFFWLLPGLALGSWRGRAAVLPSDLDTTYHQNLELRILALEETVNKLIKVINI